MQGNIILAGDLNIILSQDEKRGVSLVRDPLREQVDEIIMDWDLLDVIPSKGKYTWNNTRLGPWHINTRMDIFLVQDTFLFQGLNSSSKIFPFGGSDHKSIFLKMRNDKNIIPIPLRVSPLWVAHKDFLGIFADAWLAPVMSSSFFV